MIDGILIGVAAIFLIPFGCYLLAEIGRWLFDIYWDIHCFFYDLTHKDEE